MKERLANVGLIVPQDDLLPIARVKTALDAAAATLRDVPLAHAVEPATTLHLRRRP